MIENLNLSIVTRLNADVKRSRAIYNRIKKFERQLSIHYQEKSFYPIDAVKEISRLRKMETYLSNNYLIKNNIKCNSIKKELNQLDTPQKHWQKSTKLEWIILRPRTTELQKIYLKNLEKTATVARIATLNWRLQMALKEAIYNNHYIIFNTLTVANENYNQVWDTKSQCFTNYIKQINKVALGKENHEYFAVVEAGGKTNRNHYHVIHILKQINEETKQCPNYGKIYPTNRVINSFRKYWAYGFSSPLAVRTSYTDAWQKIGYRWSVDAFHKPLPAGSAKKVANYISKYITKSMSIKEHKKWRTRPSHNLGMTIINQSILQLNHKQLSQIIQIAKMQVLVIYQSLIPSSLLLTVAHRQILRKLKSDKQNKKLMTLEAQPSIMQRLKISTMPTQMCNLQKIGSIPTQKSNTSVIFEIQTIINNNLIKYLGTDELLPSRMQLTGTTNQRA